MQSAQRGDRGAIGYPTVGMNVSSERVQIVGIAGGSGSGKTTLARRLCAALRGLHGADHCLRIEHDSYYRDLSSMPAEERAVVNFDHPRALDNALLAQHLRELRAGRAVPALSYDFATHTRPPVTASLQPCPVVVVEGILLQSVAELRTALDLKVFVDTPADLRFVRRLRRDVAERGRSVESVCAQYLETVRPMHEEFVAPAKDGADLVVSGVGPIEDAVRRVQERIESVAESL